MSWELLHSKCCGQPEFQEQTASHLHVVPVIFLITLYAVWFQNTWTPDSERALFTEACGRWAGNIEVVLSENRQHPGHGRPRCLLLSLPTARSRAVLRYDTTPEVISFSPLLSTSLRCHCQVSARGKSTMPVLRITIIGFLTRLHMKIEPSHRHILDDLINASFQLWASRLCRPQRPPPPRPSHLRHSTDQKQRRY